MNLLAIAHDLPPVLAPQPIQIGRLLTHLPAPCKTYVATSTYATPLPCNAYTDWPRRVEDSTSAPSIHRSRLLGAGLRLFPFFFHIPEPSRYDMPALKEAVLKRWGTQRFDRLLTFAYPFASHLLGRELKKQFGCPWTAHFSDPWADNPLMDFGPLSRPFNQRWEKAVMAEADRLIFVSKETRDYYAGRYPAHAGKMAVLEHSYDPALYPPQTPAPEKGKPLLARFLGNLYGGRSFHTLFRALALLNPEQAAGLRVELVLSYKRPLELLVREYRLEHIVKIRPPVNYLDSLGLMQSAGLLITIDTPLPAAFHENLYFPSKLADYIGARRPVLALAGPGATKRVVTAYGGWTADPDSAEDAARVLGELSDGWRQGTLQAFQPAGSVVKDLSIAVKAAQFMELLQ